MPISIRAGVLVGIWPLPSFPRGQDKGEPKRSSMVVWHAVEGEGSGRGGPNLVLGPGLAWLRYVVRS